MKPNFLLLNTILILLITASCSGISTQPLIRTPTIVPGESRITGILQVKSNGESIPAKNVLLYLAATIKDSSGKDSFAAMDRINSPRTETDEKGNFEFSNIQPGIYGLVLDLISNSYLLLKPGTQNAILIEVVAGKQIDLGKLLYDSLPIPTEP